MFGWRKKRDGFEWRSYVRTTILVKRKQRQDKLEEAKQAAIDGLAEAGRAGVAAGQSGVEAAKRGINAAAREAQAAAREAQAAGAKYGGKMKEGAREAGQKLGQNLGQGLKVAGQAAKEGAARAGSGLWHFGRAAGGKIGQASGSGLDALAGGLSGVGRVMSPRVSLPLVIAAIAALIGAVARGSQHGFDAVAITASVIAMVLMCLAALPLIAGRATLSAPFSTRRYTGENGEAESAGGSGPAADLAGFAKGLAAVIVLALVVGGGFLVAPYLSVPQLPVDLPVASPIATEKIEGKARALTGDVMEVGGQRVVLRGIEAPALRQTCTDKKGRDWRCGRNALTALRKITGYERVVCTVTDTDAAGRKVADCMVGGTNIAAALVKEGSVFAGTGFFRAYGSEESEARAAKRGIWQGKAARPSEQAAN